MRERSPSDIAPKRRRRPHAMLAFLSPMVKFVAFSCLLWGSGYGLAHYLRESPNYRIQHILVQGTMILSAQEIIEASQVTRADNIFFLDPRAIAERIQALPRVKACAVTRIFPDVIAFAIEERLAVATLVVNNRTYEIDAAGAILDEVAPDAPYCGPLLTLHPPVSTVTPGEPVGRPELVEGLAVWNAYAKTRLAAVAPAHELAVFDSNDIRMYCESMPFEIRWGRGDYDAQARRLDILWQELNGRLPCTAYLDLRFGRDLACK
ncbi:MAG TPA: FtsQ-type POTRA domain-containing protein [Candidatus Hydrogenedentes bacterium]|nr:FtsQ-type POTRA domain-containing protein [Candidatus Hydrogenedentota bacterium]HPJ98269.1 FtsQ-type POTRA domain-containing protein [Candidatus Hydrogenedentota bacterium]